MTAIYGPPWNIINDAQQLLQIDPPALTACNALAAVAPRTRQLVRANTVSEVERAAMLLSRDTGAEVSIFRGAIQTRSGAWLWPLQVDVVDVHKAESDDPTTRAGFLSTVDELQQALLTIVDREEATVFRAARQALSFDYASASSAQVSRAIDRAARIIAELPRRASFSEAAGQALAEITARVTERSALSTPIQLRKTTLVNIGFQLTADQTELAQRIGSDALVFVTDEFTRRAGRVSEDARMIIADGVRQGFGRQDIGRNLNEALGHRLSGRDEWYFRVLASTAVSRSRSYGQMVGYQEAGLQQYIWLATMDERVCEVCRFLHGQTFPVATPLAAFNRVLRNPDPETAVNEFPWYRVVGGQRLEGGMRQGGDIHVQPRQRPLGERLATVRESGMGQRDVRGTHQVHSSPQAAGGTLVPPAHGLCRCTTVPV